MEVWILGSYTQHIAHANVDNHFGQRALVRRHERGTDRVDGRRQDARVWGRARGHVANIEVSDRAGVSRGARTLPTVVDTHDVAERVKTLARKLGVDLERRLGSVQFKIAARDGAGGGGGHRRSRLRCTDRISGSADRRRQNRSRARRDGGATGHGKGSRADRRRRCRHGACMRIDVVRRVDCRADRGGDLRRDLNNLRVPVVFPTFVRIVHAATREVEFCGPRAALHAAIAADAGRDDVEADARALVKRGTERVSGDAARHTERRVEEIQECHVSGDGRAREALVAAEHAHLGARRPDFDVERAGPHPERIDIVVSMWGDEDVGLVEEADLLRERQNKGIDDPRDAHLGQHLRRVNELARPRVVTREERDPRRRVAIACSLRARRDTIMALGSLAELAERVARRWANGKAADRRQRRCDKERVDAKRHTFHRRLRRGDGVVAAAPCGSDIAALCQSQDVDAVERGRRDAATPVARRVLECSLDSSNIVLTAASPGEHLLDDDIEPRAAAAFEQEALFERRRELRVDVVGSAVAVNDKRAGAFMSRAARRIWRTDALDDAHVCIESRELRRVRAAGAGVVNLGDLAARERRAELVHALIAAVVEGEANGASVRLEANPVEADGIRREGDRLRAGGDEAEAGQQATHAPPLKSRSDPRRSMGQPSRQLFCQLRGPVGTMVP